MYKSKGVITYKNLKQQLENKAESINKLINMEKTLDDDSSPHLAFEKKSQGLYEILLKEFCDYKIIIDFQIIYEKDNHLNDELIENLYDVEFSWEGVFEKPIFLIYYKNQPYIPSIQNPLNCHSISDYQDLLNHLNDGLELAKCFEIKL